MSIQENTFAAACLENSVDELNQALLDGPDSVDMEVWGLSESEWREQIELAIKEMASEI